jgi:alpha/beta superfamily hydrolase
VQTQHIPGVNLVEQAGYFTVPGAHLYTVLHQTKDPVARVLLVGPFASERHNSYIPWVRWARYLAERNIEVLRYDYRGIGESTGVFENMTIENWNEDVQFLADWLKSRSPSVPLILHGLDFGALLAGRTFHAGTGDALLLWAPPANANQSLRSTLQRRVGLEQLFKIGDERKSVADCIRQLEQGSSFEVDGYQWSSRLWCNSFDFDLPSAMGNEDSAVLAYKRPVKIVRLGMQQTPVIKGGPEVSDEGKNFNRMSADLLKMSADNFKWHHSFKFWSEFRTYFSSLFADNFEWITVASAMPMGVSND